MQGAEQSSAGRAVLGELCADLEKQQMLLQLDIRFFKFLHIAIELLGPLEVRLAWTDTVSISN